MLTYRTEHGSRPDGATAEIGIVAFQGREFAALGAMRDDAAGRAVVYVGREGGIARRMGLATTWSGDEVGTYVVTGHARGFHGARLTCYRVRMLDGSRWHGRGSGEGMILRLRRCRS